MSPRPGRLPPTKEISKGSNEPKGKSHNKYEFSRSFDKVTNDSLDTLVFAQTIKTMIAGPDFFHIGNSSIFDNISRFGVIIYSSAKAFFSPLTTYEASISSCLL